MPFAVSKNCISHTKPFEGTSATISDGRKATNKHKRSKHILHNSVPRGLERTRSSQSTRRGTLSNSARAGTRNGERHKPQTHICGFVYLRVMPASASSSAVRRSMNCWISLTILRPVALHAVLNRVCMLAGKSRLRRLIGSAGTTLTSAGWRSCPVPPFSYASMAGRTEQRYEKFHRSPGIPQNSFPLHF
jgi:hypothetical protein